MRPTRVTIILTEFPHYRFEVFRELESRDDLEITWAGAPTARDASIVSADISSLANFYPLRNRKIGRAWFQHGLRSLARPVKEADVVLLTGDPSVISTWLITLYCKTTLVPVAFWTLGWRSFNVSTSVVVKNYFYRMATGLLVYGERGKRIGVSHGFDERRIWIVGNSVGAGRPQDPARERPRIICVGRPTRAKQLDRLIRAVASDSALRDSVLVTIVGDGPESKKLSDLAEHLQVPAELHDGSEDEVWLAQLYAESFVSVVPGAAGLTVIQSLAHGIPVVTSDDLDIHPPEVEAIIQGKTGLFVGDRLDDLASGIKYWRLRDSLERQQVSARCRHEYDVRWTPKVHASRIANAVHELADHAEPPRSQDLHSATSVPARLYARIRRPPGHRSKRIFSRSDVSTGANGKLLSDVKRVVSQFGSKFRSP